MPSPAGSFAVPLIALALAVSFTGEARAASPFEGAFNTSYGVMVFNGGTQGRLATYGSDSGRITGTALGNRLEGHWVEESSGRRCPTPVDGSFYWGRIQLRVDGDALSGTWSYCELPPNKSWSGTRSSRGTTPSPTPAGKFYGVFSTNYGDVSFTSATSGRLGTYTSGGRFVGYIRANQLNGHWVKDTSARRCQTERDGSFYWGRVVFTVTGDRLEGRWGYCNDEPARMWTGNRN
jgi:hypothetical protein